MEIVCFFRQLKLEIRSPHIWVIAANKISILFFQYDSILEICSGHKKISFAINWKRTIPLVCRGIIIVHLLKVDRRNIHRCCVGLVDIHCRIFWYFPKCITKRIQCVWKISRPTNSITANKCILSTFLCSRFAFCFKCQMINTRNFHCPEILFVFYWYFFSEFFRRCQSVVSENINKQLLTQ